MTLTDLCQRHGSGYILLRCPACGRTRIFWVSEIRDHFRKKRWSDRWQDVGRRFRCAICGTRPREPQWVERALDVAVLGEQSCLAPYGINPDAWALASPEDRAKLIKARR